MEQPPARNLARLIGIAAVIGILVIVLAAYAVSNHKTTLASSRTTSKITQASPTASATASASDAYKDGTYSATGTYASPGGQEEIGVQLTIKNNTVTDSTLTEYADGESRQYQDMFASGYKSLVIGKKLDDVNLTVVSGSSLTSSGFNQAVSSIKSEAKA
jgi:uncharacterized protein with FMN-binding domain